MSELFEDRLLLKKTTSTTVTHHTATPTADDSNISKQSEDAVDQPSPTTNNNEEIVIETVVAREALNDKVVCLFFSASWCAPCHHFIPLLKEIYTELIRRGEPLEVVFLSFDKSSEEMTEYYKTCHGNWLALPFEDSFKDTLAERYSINMVPKLIVIQPDGEIITIKGRKDIQDKGVVCMRGWHQALVKTVVNVPAETEESQDVS